MTGNHNHQQQIGPVPLSFPDQLWLRGCFFNYWDTGVRRWFWVRGATIMTHTKTSSLAFLSLQTCFQNFHLNQKSRGGGRPPPCFLRLCGTSLPSHLAHSWPDLKNKQRSSKLADSLAEAKVWKHVKYREVCENEAKIFSRSKIWEHFCRVK